MKKIFAIVLAVVLLATMSGVALADKPAVKGNGIDFNGQHYNLNLIGKSKVMPGDYDNPDRHTMFVPLSTEDFECSIDLQTPNNLDEETLPGMKITMTQGPEFAMVDGNATDCEGAFELGPGKYAVYIAVKAKKPNTPGNVDITGWVEAYDNLGALWYYIDVGDVSVSKSNKKFTDATDLLFVTTGEDDFGFLTGSEADYIAGLGMWVFDYMSGLDTWYEDSGETAGYDLSDLAYFWQLQNNGAKLIQVRFYPM
jgi:hypothetical protein